MAGSSSDHMPPAGFTTHEITCPLCDCNLKLQIHVRVDISSAVAVAKRRGSYYDAPMEEPEDDPDVPAKNAKMTPLTPPLESPPPVTKEAVPATDKIGYKHIALGDFYECLSCEQTFAEEFSCWQHIVSRPECHEDPAVQAEVTKYLSTPPGPRRKKR